MTHKAIALTVTVMTLSVFWICFTARIASPNRVNMQFNPTLLKLVAPTRSLWPARYCSSSDRTATCLHLGFGTLLRDLCAGIVELRSPSTSARALLQSYQLGPDDIFFSLHMELYMWISAAWFLFKHELLLQPYQVRLHLRLRSRCRHNLLPSKETHQCRLEAT